MVVVMCCRPLLVLVIFWVTLVKIGALNMAVGTVIVTTWRYSQPCINHAPGYFVRNSLIMFFLTHNLPTFCNTAAKLGIFFDTATHLATFLRQFNT